MMLALMALSWIAVALAHEVWKSSSTPVEAVLCSLVLVTTAEASVRITLEAIGVQL